MNDIGIFIFGLFVFSVVAAAILIIYRGFLEDIRDRRDIDAGPDARSYHGEATRTEESGKTHSASTPRS